MKVNKKAVIFLLLGAGQAFCYLLLFFFGDLRKNIIPCITVFVPVFILYIVSIAFYGQLFNTAARNKLDTHASCRIKHFFLIATILFAVLFRLIMLFSPPALSDDIYRYVWEGKMVEEGINPYLYSPSDQRLEQYRDEQIFPGINHPELSTIYPPLSLFIFSLTAGISPTVRAMNLTFLLFDFFTIILLIFILNEINIDPVRIIIYAWNPLIIMEFAGNGHVDSAGIFFLFLSFYLFSRRKLAGSIACLCFSFLNKLLPVIFLPFMLRKRKAALLSLFCIITAVFYWPFIKDWGNIFCTLETYSQRWQFNSSLYELFLLVFSTELTARKVSAVIFLTIVLGCFVSRKKKLQPEDSNSLYRTGFICFGALFLLTPVLHPWYICWIVPFLVIFPNRAWIFLSGAVFLSYYVLKGYTQSGVWQENSLIRFIEYVPFYFLLLHDAGKKLLHKQLQ